jgi:hypothetical protein
MYCFESFLKGYKPAVLMNPNHDDENDIKSLAGYPSVENVQVFDSAGQVLYFQNEELKQDYLYQSKNTLNPHSPEFHKLLGITLGFPPKAVDFYVSELMSPDDYRHDRVGLDYCGISCIGGLDDLLENTAFLWDQIKNPKEEMEIWYRSIDESKPKTYEISYQNYDHVIQAKKELSRLVHIKKGVG